MQFIFCLFSSDPLHVSMFVYPSVSKLRFYGFFSSLFYITQWCCFVCYYLIWIKLQYLIGILYKIFSLCYLILPATPIETSMALYKKFHSKGTIFVQRLARSLLTDRHTFNLLLLYKDLQKKKYKHRAK